jgi:hypothetical protein
MIRFYLLPMERVGVWRGPKYFKWMFNPNGIDCLWSCKDYGSIDMGTLAADISQADHNSLIINTDVYSFPENLDVTMAQAERSAMNTYLEAHALPGDWISSSETFYSAARTITGMMLYNQRVCAILGYPENPYIGITLNTQYRNIPNPLHDALSQAAVDLGYTWTVANNDQARKVFKLMANQWGSNPIEFGFVTL